MREVGHVESRGSVGEEEVFDERGRDGAGFRFVRGGWVFGGVGHGGRCEGRLSYEGSRYKEWERSVCLFE